MGTLGAYLKSAREARGLDLRDAAQQTRISLQYLKALEAGDFSKLPGEVFVKGFLKNYARFLKLDEAEVLKRYAELRSPSVSSPPPTMAQEPVHTVADAAVKTPLEPFIWGAAILLAIVIFLFTGPTRKQHVETPPAGAPVTAPTSTETGTSAPMPAKTEKLYLEIIALENTWVLVRTDASPQKKVVLKKGESVIWSADERFLLTYGSSGAIRLLLNGKELTVAGPQNAVVRDLIITTAGIANQQLQPKAPRRAKPKPQQPAEGARTPPPDQPAQPQPQAAEQPKPEIQAAPEPAPPAQPAPPSAPPAPEGQPVPAQ